ncbi:hypothetical protein SNE40_009538 [Patella caerulea]|uniref:Uncharacterized protein n=1 Tax=Patella caerulea TaxID=87958 RepID=A0AAN8JRG9_PATCE
MAKKTDEIKNVFQASMIRLQDLFEDFDALLTRDFLPADLTQVYENIQEENLVFNGLHNKYAQSLLCRTETETSKTELQEIRSMREKFRISITMTSERYNQALKGKEHDREPPSEDRQSFETKIKEIEKTAGATAAAAAAEVVKALTPKYEGRCELERLPCPSWDGKRTTYATFKKHFSESMVQNHQDASKQLIRLRTAIKDPGAKWKRKVETCSDITRAWTLLDREFQNNQKLIAEIYNNLDKFRLKPTVLNLYRNSHQLFEN